MAIDLHGFPEIALSDVKVGHSLGDKGRIYFRVWLLPEPLKAFGDLFETFAFTQFAFQRVQDMQGLGVPSRQIKDSAVEQQTTGVPRAFLETMLDCLQGLKKSALLAQALCTVDKLRWVR